MGKKLEKRGNILKIGDKEFKLSDFDTSRKEELEEMRKNLLI